MTEANPENRDARTYQIADDGDRILTGCGWIPRSIRKKNTVRLARQHLLRGCVSGQHRHTAARGCKAAQDIAFDAVIDCNDMKLRLDLLGEASFRGPNSLAPAIALRRGHAAG